MIEKTDAIVLRVTPYSDTSHIVTWLTPTRGRLATIFKGAQRPKSAHLGQYDLFYTCELLFYSRDRQGLHIARECAPLNMRTRFRHDWRACVAASYVADVIYRSSFSGAHAAELYTLVATTLDSTASRPAKVQLLCWFELQLFTVLGVAPQLSSCAVCTATLETRPMNALLSMESGGLICAPCAARHTNTSPLTPDVVAILRTWQRADDPRTAHNTRCTWQQLKQLSYALGLFTDYHLDIALPSRYIAHELLASQRKRRVE